MSFLNELIERSFAVSIACSRLRDSGEKSFSKEEMRKTRGSALYYLRAWYKLPCQMRINLEMCDLRL